MCISTGILEVVPAAGEWIKQVLANTVIPSFTWTIDSTTGAIDVVLDRHGEVEQAGERVSINSVVHDKSMLYLWLCYVREYVQDYEFLYE